MAREIVPEVLPARQRRQTIVVVLREQIHTPSWEEWERERDRERPGTPVWIRPALSTEARPLSTPPRPDAARPRRARKYQSIKAL
jgi:hypothetical protein